MTSTVYEFPTLERKRRQISWLEVRWTSPQKSMATAETSGLSSAGAKVYCIFSIQFSKEPERISKTTRHCRTCNRVSLCCCIANNLPVNCHKDSSRWRCRSQAAQIRANRSAKSTCEARQLSAMVNNLSHSTPIRVPKIPC